MPKRSTADKPQSTNADSVSTKTGKWGRFAYLMASFFAGVVLTGLLFSVFGLYTLKTFSRMEELLHGAPWNLPTRVYGRPYEIFVGGKIQRPTILSRLSRLGYYPVASVQSSGEYSWDEKGMDLFLHDTQTIDGVRQGFPARVEIADNVVIGIWNTDDGKHLSSIMLDPELLGSIYDPSTEDRRPMKLEEVPSLFVDCLLVSEDKDFFAHHGIDPVGITRAVWVNLKRGRYAQGASTITQQLVRSLFLTRKRTIRRKMDEALMAVLLELTRDKDKILELYINECYYGQAGAISVAGLRQGARFYFGTEPRHLKVEQCAMLAAILRGPNYYQPFQYPDRVKQRRDFILARLFQEGKITEEEKNAAIAAPLPEAPHSLAGSAPYVVDAVRRSIADLLDVRELQTEGYSIFTTIDTHIQSAAQQAVKEGIEELESKYPHLSRVSQPLQAALIAIDPYSGAVRAMVGGRDFESSQYNHVLLAKRPIGSIIKPFLALCALEGSHRGDYDWRPNSLLSDSPITIQTPSGPWSPENYTKEYLGMVTLRRAIEQSLNVPTVRLSQQIGIPTFADFLQKLGIDNPPRVPSLVLGTLELTPYTVAGLFSLFPNRGELASPFFLRAIVTTSNEKLPLAPPSPAAAASPEASYQVLSMLQGVLERGTAKSARQLGWSGIAAGKTGTTDDRQDAWFAGITPDLVTIVWIGFDHPEPTGLTGSMGALPIWVKFMNLVDPAGNSEPFPIPDGLSSRRIHYATGQFAFYNGPDIIHEFFLKTMAGEETPAIEIPVHSRTPSNQESITKALPESDITESELPEETIPSTTPSRYYFDPKNY
ncbi:MAG: hypothetical protein C4527_06010 [Candidatus Omnitrophota bacterium]|jgi:penicillin-binding protein 1B|nr:MAG: hypothetical protein C4527_06010 [Candidatus Omnitrophota bacterium]